MIQRTEARRLASTNEWSLISSSLPPALETLSLTRLKSKIARARKLREKYQDLYRRQKLSSKSVMTGAPYERLNVRTGRKKQMFDEAISRLKVRLGKMSASSKRTAGVDRLKPAKGSMRSLLLRSARQSEGRKHGLIDRAASPAAPKAAKRSAAGYARRHSHTASVTRRRQAKRDSINRMSRR